MTSATNPGVAAAGQHDDQQVHLRGQRREVRHAADAVDLAVPGLDDHDVTGVEALAQDVLQDHAPGVRPGRDADDADRAWGQEPRHLVQRPRRAGGTRAVTQADQDVERDEAARRHRGGVDLDLEQIVRSEVGEPHESGDGVREALRRQARRLPADGGRGQPDGRRAGERGPDGVERRQGGGDDGDLAARLEVRREGLGENPAGADGNDGSEVVRPAQREQQLAARPRVVGDELGDREALGLLMEAGAHRRHRGTDRRRVARHHSHAPNLGLVLDSRRHHLHDDAVTGKRRQQGGIDGVFVRQEKPPRHRESGGLEQRQALRLEELRPAVGAGALEDGPDRGEVGFRGPRAGCRRGGGLGLGHGDRVRLAGSGAQGRDRRGLATSPVMVFVSARRPPGVRPPRPGPRAGSRPASAGTRSAGRRRRTGDRPG